MATCAVQAAVDMHHREPQAFSLTHDQNTFWQRSTSFIYMNTLQPQVGLLNAIQHNVFCIPDYPCPSGIAWCSIAAAPCALSCN